MMATLAGGGDAGSGIHAAPGPPFYMCRACPGHRQAVGPLPVCTRSE